LARKADLYPNLTVKKIPSQVLSRCEWGHDDYSLRAENLPSAPPEPGQQALDFVKAISAEVYTIV
jgi:adenine-specific DNA-methyltransferase